MAAKPDKCKWWCKIITRVFIGPKLWAVNVPATQTSGRPTFHVESATYKCCRCGAVYSPNPNEQELSDESFR